MTSTNSDEPRLDRGGLLTELNDLLDQMGANHNRDQLTEILYSAARLSSDDPSRLNLKITNVALKEMRHAFKVFKPYEHVPKVTIFGSARTLPTDPLYDQARRVAATLADQGWMIVTGGGPGIMAAGLEGAGRENSFGINIRLPFEQEANEIVAGDPKLVTMKYFFTRKLMLIKESRGFVILPGGFGTLDETFELLTLVQTGKADPVPIVLLEVAGGTYWRAWEEFVRHEVAARGLVSPADHLLYKVTDSADEAARELLGFYRNYHSRRFVNGRMVIRLKSAPTDDEMVRLNLDFADICETGEIERIEATPAEVADDDYVDLPRVQFTFDRMQHGRLRQFVDTLNRLQSAPREATLPPQPEE